MMYRMLLVAMACALAFSFAAGAQEKCDEYVDDGTGRCVEGARDGSGPRNLRDGGGARDGSGGGNLADGQGAQDGRGEGRRGQGQGHLEGRGLGNRR